MYMYIYMYIYIFMYVYIINAFTKFVFQMSPNPCSSHYSSAVLVAGANGASLRATGAKRSVDCDAPEGSEIIQDRFPSSHLSVICLFRKALSDIHVR